jgi:hypothetical protein
VLKNQVTVILRNGRHLFMFPYFQLGIGTILHAKMMRAIELLDAKVAPVCGRKFQVENVIRITTVN